MRRPLSRFALPPEACLWCAFWAACCWKGLHPSANYEVLRVCLAQLAIVGTSFRPRQGTVSADPPSQSVWRQEKEYTRADGPGNFMGRLLVPLLCLQMAAAAGEDKEQWMLYSTPLCLLNCLFWEEKRNDLLLFCMGIFMAVFVDWNVMFQKDKTDDTNNLLWMLLLVLLWLPMFHSIKSWLPPSFHGVFTPGEWRIVTSLAAVGIVQYLRSIMAQQPPNHATVAMAGLLSVLLVCPIMEQIKKIPFSRMLLKHRRPSSTMSNHQELLTLLFQLPFWFGLPLLGVEVSEFYVFRQPTQLPAILYNLPTIPSWCIPRSLGWLVGFLVQVETPIMSTALPTIPRYGWLLYWAFVLAIAIPLAPEPKNTSKKLSKAHVVVLMRKWFHGIAVLLFGPVTMAAPQLLSLSYAIALAILVLLESARTTFPMIAAFHARYLDTSKDSRGGNGLVISHMALIVGCALPLWISEIIMVSQNSTLSPAIIALLQLWGVLSLGIGDAMGAIVGVLYGRRKWSVQNARTLEGSMAMWTSLWVSCWFLVVCVVGARFAEVWWSCLITVTFVTLLEAHTCQIDNLVLPLAGVASLLLTMPT